MKLNKRFTTFLQKSPKKGGWTCVVMPGSAEYLGTRGLVKLRDLADGFPFQSSSLARDDSRHKLPIKAELQKATTKKSGNLLTVALEKPVEQGGD